MSWHYFEIVSWTPGNNYNAPEPMRLDNCLVGLWWVDQNALPTGEYQVKLSSALVDCQGMRSRGRKSPQLSTYTWNPSQREFLLYHSSWH